MGLKMNGALNGTGAALNGVGVGNIHPMSNGNHKMKSEKKQGTTPPALGQNFMSQSFVESLMKGGGVLPNSNLFLPMVPNLHENYGVMNAALFASLSNPLHPMNFNLNPYHIQNLLKLSGVPHMSAMDEEESRSKSPKSPAERNSNPEDMIEEVNEQEDTKLVMDIEKRRAPPSHHESEDDERSLNGHQQHDEDDEMSIKHEDDKSHSPPASIKQEHNNEEDALRCRHCDKVFNHPAEHLQHETILCSSLMMKKHELMHMAEQSMAEDDMDDRESKMSTESERKVRVRTAISDEQQAVLKEYYAMNPRPNREDFRNIASRLQLDARVVQVVRLKSE
jgi:hypothetical protein